MGVDLRCTGETGAEDRVRLRVRLNLLFAARSGAQQRRSGVGGGQEAGFSREPAGESGWRNSRGGPEGAGSRSWWCKEKWVVPGEELDLYLTFVA
jgi:hypothetical protein